MMGTVALSFPHITKRCNFETCCALFTSVVIIDAALSGKYYIHGHVSDAEYALLSGL